MAEIILKIDDDHAKAFIRDRGCAELIRCKDCWKRNTIYCPVRNTVTNVDKQFADNWFCADGEPKENNPCEDCERDCHMCGITIEKDV